ncbi:MAG: isoprenylcysteine carboxylmethyltransferase family protein [Planctomycetota bacterium]
MSALTDNTPTVDPSGQPPRLFRYRSVAIALVVTPVVFLSPFIHWAWSPALGIAVLALGILGRLFSIRQLGKRARVHRVKTAELVVTGPFAYVRNPIYISNAAVAVGAGLIGGAVIYSAILAVLMISLYDAVVRREEPFLRQAFGEAYDRYRSEVSRWWPRLSKPPITRESELVPFPWAEVFRREKGFVFGSLLAGAFMAVRGPLFGAVLGDLPDRRPIEWGLTLVALIGVFLGMSYAVHRKSRRLDERKQAVGQSLATAES